MTDPGRNKDLARIHALKRQAGLDDDTYRDVLERVSRVRSAKDLSAAGRRNVIREMDRLAGGKRTRPGHVSPQVAKMRALWLALWNMGTVPDPDDRALLGFVKRVAHVEAFQFLRPGDASKVIEGLRARLEREGVPQPHDDPGGMAGRRNLVFRQWAFLGVYPGELGGLTARQLDDLANRLGRRVRALKADGTDDATVMGDVAPQDAS
ncbi:MAG: regulatory protein GemA, partial [Alphaproteobacteria bacterium]